MVQLLEVKPQEVKHLEVKHVEVKHLEIDHCSLLVHLAAGVSQRRQFVLLLWS